MAYRSIIERLAQGTEPLPHAISEDNLSNWFHGGYRDWRRQQQEKEFADARAAVPSQPARGFSRSSAIEAEAACTAVACKRRPAEETVEPNHTIPNLIESSNS